MFNFSLIISFIIGAALCALLVNISLKPKRFYTNLIVISSGLAGGMMCAGLITVISFAIDDWSACRLVPSVSLLYGYPLYASPDDPATGFAYGPFGAWIYLPAAIVAKFWESPTVGVLAGDLISFILLYFPVAIILFQHKFPPTQSFLAAILALALFIALAPLRYVAFSIHVDAIGLCTSALAIIFAARVNGDGMRYSWLCGIVCAIAVLSKQTFLPIAGICVLLLLIAKSGALFRFILSFFVTFFCVLGILVMNENLEAMVFFYFKFFSGVPSRMSFVDSFIVFLPHLSLQLLVLFFVIFAGGKIKQRFDGFFISLQMSYAYRVACGFLLASLCYIPLGIITAKSIGGDVNHYATSIYFLLLLTVLFLIRIPNVVLRTMRAGLFISIAFLIPPAITMSYVQKFPGWYLYKNNFLEQASEYSKNNPGEIYFPWQPLSVLLGEGRLYHLGEQLHYESILGWKRHTDEQYRAHLPLAERPVAIRPYGAPAAVIPLLYPNHIPAGAEPSLPGWTIFRLQK